MVLGTHTQIQTQTCAHILPLRGSMNACKTRFRFLTFLFGSRALKTQRAKRSFSTKLTAAHTTQNLPILFKITAAHTTQNQRNGDGIDTKPLQRFQQKNNKPIAFYAFVNKRYIAKQAKNSSRRCWIIGFVMAEVTLRKDPKNLQR
jgi:hypothetical protein